ncbi:MAG: DUF4105 domain-containing protein [Terriglobales bacterium]
MSPDNKTSRTKRGLHWLGVGFVWLLLAGMTFWAAAALYFDLSFAHLPLLTPILYLVVIAAAVYAARTRPRRMVISLAGFLIVLTFWLSLKPSNNHQWQPNVSQTPWAEIDGDRVTIHNFRNCYYRQDVEFTCEWLTKAVFLSQLRGLDLFVDYWGSPWIEHPIVSFQFGNNAADADYVAASIEARYQVGQSYSPIRSFFRQFTIVYVLANERDLIRLRTNYRSGEDVYLYHMVASPEWSRLVFLQYLQRANRLRDHPRWFNAVTDNCTTNVFAQMAATGHLPPGSSRYAWWTLLNGRAPEMLYRGGNFAGNLPFPELKKQALINPVANTLDDAPDFSRRIRLHRPGFGFLGSDEDERKSQPPSN